MKKRSVIILILILGLVFLAGGIFAGWVELLSERSGKRES